ncbi:hypothetical protein HYS94_05665 [Candidatus Daviesbacteria bacterium]|nr:hypothetical protein [Candidatus Daviesbacteria bacterium]
MKEEHEIPWSIGLPEEVRLGIPLREAVLNCLFVEAENLHNAGYLIGVRSAVSGFRKLAYEVALILNLAKQEEKIEEELRKTLEDPKNNRPSFLMRGHMPHSDGTHPRWGWSENPEIWQMEARIALEELEEIHKDPTLFTLVDFVAKLHYFSQSHPSFEGEMFGREMAAKRYKEIYNLLPQYTFQRDTK